VITMKTIKQLLFGTSSKINGLIAFMIVASIALGCTCGKNFDLANMGKDKDNGTNSTRTANSDFNSSSPTDDDDDTAPSKTRVDSLVKATTKDFAAAIDSGDFSTLYGNSSKEFQSTYTEDQTKEVFKVFVTSKKRVTPILEKALTLEPDYSAPPSYRTEQGHQIIVANGKYATKPLPTNFEYEFIENDGDWKMLKLIVKIQ
jgi:hypothetical protein